MMPPHRTIHHPPAKLHCPVQGCHQKVQSKSGLTRHIKTIHTDYHPVNTFIPRTPTGLRSFPPSEVDDSSSVTSPPLPARDCDMFDAFNASHVSDLHDLEASSSPPHFLAASSRPSSPLHDNEESVVEIVTEYHPLINGMITTIHFVEYSDKRLQASHAMRMEASGTPIRHHRVPLQGIQVIGPHLVIVLPLRQPTLYTDAARCPLLVSTPCANCGQLHSCHIIMFLHFPTIVISAGQLTQ
jgi:hypothetical protein